MATGRSFIRMFFDGGWATDFGPTTDIAPDSAGHVRLPWLIDADDVVFELDGGPHKAPGTAKLNDAALESGATVKGIFDCWFSGTSGVSAQHRIVHVGTKIKKDDGDASFTDLFTGLESGKVPSYAMLEDVLVMTSDSTTDVPKEWDGTTAQNLQGSPPNFAFCVSHQNRMWAAGNAAQPSRLYYSANLDPQDWTGAGSGNIDIDPDDGDRITGIRSHKNELWVFKGPYRGAIHRITGSAPTGDDSFARKTYVNGIGAVAHNLIFPIRNDLGFVWSDGTVHTLQAVERFGDFNEASLSRPIDTWISEHVNFGRLKHAWAVTHEERGQVLFALPVDGSSDPNIVLVLDYRFDPPRWSKWPSYDTEAVCLASVIDATDNDRRIVLGGGSDGFVRKFHRATRSIDGSTALSFKVTTPVLTFGNPIQMKIMAGGAVGLAPKNDGNLTFGWTRDLNTQQTHTVSQGGVSDVLGTASANQFTLGTSKLGGGIYVDRFFPLSEGGEFRGVQLQVTNLANNEDVELHSVSAIVSPGAWSMED